jgi:hypothetical protein
MPKIVFNGKEYESPEAMPPEVRSLFEMASGILSDKDNDGTPDIFQGMGAGAATVTGATQYLVDGKSYASLEEMPPEVRKQYEQLIQHVDANRNGVPDMLEGGVLTSSILLGGRAPQPAAEAPPAQPQLVKVVGESGGPGGMLAVALIVIVLLIGAVVYLLLTR